MTEYKCGSAKSCKYGDMCKPNFNICVCSHYKAEEPQTNEEWIHTLNTEQLAEWICSVHEKCYYCGAKRISDRERCPFGDGKCRNNKHEFAMWLKQPHTKESDTDE